MQQTYGREFGFKLIEFECEVLVYWKFSRYGCWKQTNLELSNYVCLLTDITIVNTCEIQIAAAYNLRLSPGNLYQGSESARPIQYLWIIHKRLS